MTMNDPGPPRPKRRWYQFSLRTLLAVGLVVVLGCGPSKEQQATDAYNRGLARDEKGESEKAIADFTEVLRLNPEYARAYYSRGYAYQHKGDHAKAEADFSKARKLGYEPE